MAVEPFTPKLPGKLIAIFVDNQFEDVEVMYPKVK